MYYLPWLGTETKVLEGKEDSVRSGPDITQCTFPPCPADSPLLLETQAAAQEVLVGGTWNEYFY